MVKVEAHGINARQMDLRNPAEIQPGMAVRSEDAEAGQSSERNCRHVGHSNIVSGKN